VSSGGRIFYITANESLNLNLERNAARARRFLVARDAYNGRRLWSMPYPCEGRYPKGIEDNLVAYEDKLYLILNRDVVVLDGATGDLIKTYETGTNPSILRIYKDHLIIAGPDSLRIRDLGTGNIKWQKSSRIVDAIVDVESDRIFAISREGRLYSFNFEDGVARWPGGISVGSVPTYFFAKGGVLVLVWSASTGNFRVYSAEDGRELWGRSGLYRPKRTGVSFAEGLIWYRSNNFAFGVDPLTGVERRRFSDSGFSHGCTRRPTLEKYLVGVRPFFFVDRQTGERSSPCGGRLSCEIGFVPANGLLYTMPVKCDCVNSVVKGFIAFSGSQITSSSSRLYLGPAYTGSFPSDDPPSELDWATFRHDPQRSCYSKSTVSFQLNHFEEIKICEKPALPEVVNLDWKSNPLGGDILTQPVIADGLIFVSLVESHCVVAIDEKTREERWRFTTGGRLDVPPTIYKGLCLIGSADGYVYCLRANDGELVWRYRVGPSDVRITTYGQLSSKWPVVGGVLVVNDVAYVLAGRSCTTDGGLYLHAIDIATGNTLREEKRDRNMTVADILVSDGRRVGKANTGLRWMSLIGGSVGDFKCLKSAGGTARVLDREWETPAAKHSYGKPNERELRSFLRKYGLLKTFGRTEGQLVAGCPEGGKSFAYSCFKPRVVVCDEPMLIGYENNNEIWRIDLPKNYQVEAMAFTDDVLFVAGVVNMHQPDKEGFLWAISPQEGIILKRVELSVPPVSEGMAIAQGKLYLTTRDGRLICFYDDVSIDSDSGIIDSEERFDKVAENRERRLFNWRKEGGFSRPEKTKISSKIPVGFPLPESKDTVKISERNTFEPIVSQTNEEKEFGRTTSSSDFTSGRFKEYTMVTDDVLPEVREERNNLAEEDIILSSQKLKSKEVVTDGICFGMGFVVVFLLLFASRNWLKFKKSKKT
jgi:outer membrane protein assembly factor BamB